MKTRQQTLKEKLKKLEESKLEQEELTLKEKLKKQEEIILAQEGLILISIIRPE